MVIARRRHLLVQNDMKVTRANGNVILRRTRRTRLTTLIKRVRLPVTVARRFVNSRVTNLVPRLGNMKVIALCARPLLVGNTNRYNKRHLLRCLRTASVIRRFNVIVIWATRVNLGTNNKVHPSVLVVNGKQVVIRTGATGLRLKRTNGTPTLSTNDMKANSRCNRVTTFLATRKGRIDLVRLLQIIMDEVRRLRTVLVKNHLTTINNMRRVLLDRRHNRPITSVVICANGKRPFQ